ncbi:MAG: AmmeMemoRadiSam system protein A [Alphaproteobacteria bacterium]
MSAPLTDDDFEAQTKALLDAHGQTLLGLATASIRQGLDDRTPLAIDIADYAAELSRDGACFVTLKRGGKLRGCIGSPEASRPLVQDVVENAYCAAFRDPRFNALTADEFKDTELSISVLSPSEAINFTDEDDLLDGLRPGVDGLIIEDGPRRALFLPAVWRQLPEKQEFLGHLKVKAGMRGDHFSANFKAWRFIAAEISDT